MDSGSLKVAGVTAAFQSGRAAGAVVWKRLATAAVFIPTFAWIVCRAPNWVFPLLVVAVGALATWELARMFERAGQTVYRWLSVVCGIAVTASFLVPGAPRAVLTVAVVVTVVASVLSGAPPTSQPVALALLGLTYVSWLLGHALLLRALPDGAWLVLFLVGVTWTGESAAYVVGSALGRHKLAPLISPRKTVEGAVAQLVVSVGAALALGAWLLPEWAEARTVAAGALLGVVGQLGDLGESVIKRSVGAKDTGALVPGHGGVLDRLDSLLFNVPVFFYYVTYLGGAPR